MIALPKIIQIRKNKNSSLLESKFSKLYEEIIEKYKQLSLLYKKPAKLNYQVDMKLRFLDERIFKIKIYIKAKNIGDDDFVKFYPSTNTQITLKKFKNSLDFEVKNFLT